MALGDFMGGVVKQQNIKDASALAGRNVAVNEGNLALGQDSLGFAQQQAGVQQASEATQELIKASEGLAKSIKSIVESGKEVPPSLVKSAEQFEAAAPDPNTKLMIQGLFAEAVGANTPEQAAITQAGANVAGAEAITGETLTPEQELKLAGIGQGAREKLFVLQDAFTDEQDPVKKDQIGRAIEKLISKSSGISINTGEKAKGAFAIADKKFLDDIADRGLAADDTLRNVEIIMTSLDELGDGPLSTGALAGIRGGLANFSETFGLSDEFSSDLANLTQIDALSNKMTIAETQALKGAINQKEFEAASKIPPNIDNTPLANVYLAKRMQALALFDAKRLELGQSISEANPDLSNNQVAKELRKEFKNIPWVSKSLRTPRGLPMFFMDFVNDAHSKNPNVSIQKLAKAFRKADTVGK